MTARPPERDDDGSVDVEAAWADIVAHWDDASDRTPPQDTAHTGDDVDDPDRTDPVGGVPPARQDPPPTGAPAPTAGAPSAAPPPSVTPAPRPGTGDEVVDPGDEDDWGVARSRVGGDRANEAAQRDADLDAALDDERYRPPDPPPLPRGDPVSRLAWAGVLGAPLFFVLAALFWHTAPGWLVMAAVAAFVAGFATLVVRLPEDRDDHDDGAVV